MRADTAVRPYAEDLNIHAASGDQRITTAARHKKTTHLFDCRLVESVGVSTPDIIRLPNQAGFGIRGGLSLCLWMRDSVGIRTNSSA